MSIPSLPEPCGPDGCTCTYGWASFGRLSDASLAYRWVRVSDNPGCLRHPDPKERKTHDVR